jgi:hypothetical protein
MICIITGGTYGIQWTISPSTFVTARHANKIGIVVTQGVWFWDCIESVDSGGIKFEGHAPCSGAGLNPGPVYFEPLLVASWTIVGNVITTKLFRERDGDRLDSLCRKGDDDPEKKSQHAGGGSSVGDLQGKYLRTEGGGGLLELRVEVKC